MAAMSLDVGAEDVDGRTARRDRNRVAVLDAVLALFREGNLQPRPEDVAGRSGVSLRSVYRYYSDLGELLRAAMARHLEIVGPKLAVHEIGQGPLDGRIDRFVEGRLDLYELVAPTARAAKLAAPGNAVIRDRYESTRTALRHQVQRHFRPELAELAVRPRRAVIAAVDALTQLEGLDYYRVHRRCSRRETAALLRVAIERLLQ
jgi:AcrR family transcriptional regulator